MIIGLALADCKYLKHVSSSRRVNYSCAERPEREPGRPDNNRASKMSSLRLTYHHIVTLMSVTSRLPPAPNHFYKLMSFLAGSFRLGSISIYLLELQERIFTSLEPSRFRLGARPRWLSFAPRPIAPNNQSSRPRSDTYLERDWPERRIH